MPEIKRSAVGFGKLERGEHVVAGSGSLDGMGMD
jgi:hypothetical protein